MCPRISVISARNYMPVFDFVESLLDTQLDFNKPEILLLLIQRIHTYTFLMMWQTSLSFILFNCRYHKLVVSQFYGIL